MPSNESPKSQIKSRQRVAEHGEVFTNPREVNAMLDLVRDESFRLDILSNNTMTYRQQMICLKM